MTIVMWWKEGLSKLMTDSGCWRLEKGSDGVLRGVDRKMDSS